MKVKIPIKAKLKKIKSTFEFKPLKIESGIFPETAYVGSVGAVNLYTYLLYGTKHIPARNILPDVQEYINSNMDDFINIYLTHGHEEAGHKIGNRINTAHKQRMSEYSAIPNALATIKRKGFDDPFIWTGALLRSLTYKVDDGGLNGGG